ALCRRAFESTGPAANPDLCRSPGERSRSPGRPRAAGARPVIGIPGSSLTYCLGQGTPLVLGCEKNLEHAQGRDESARLSGADAYNHCFALPCGCRSSTNTQMPSEHDSTITISLS